MAESGDWVLVDVRPANKFEAAHPEGAVNVQWNSDLLAFYNDKTTFTKEFSWERQTCKHCSP